ncbi:MAG: hypothetical protein JST04_08450 [Bdellovibrionales bacterium]|nr:hypothetical protein [Bdellovibrionales bacterium]
MKTIISLFALSMLAMSSAFAGTVYMSANDFGSLPSCGGVVQTKVANYNTQLNVIFSNVSQCSNFDIVSANGSKVNYPNQKLQGQNMNRYGSFTIPMSLIDYGSNTIRIALQSNSAKHADTIVIKVQATGNTPNVKTTYMTSNAYSALTVCGGYVQTKVAGGNLNVIFKNVSQCSNFDIVGANGEKVDYPNMKLQGTNNNRSGSFTIPARMIQWGGNTVRLSLKSNSGAHSELIVINYLAF